MCDCYWEKCSACEISGLPVHIADFCMERESIEVYCAQHLPDRDVVVYELVEARFDDDPPPGWKMGVRYLKEPPHGYGLRAAEPNCAAEYLAEVRGKRGGRRYFTRKGFDLSTSPTHAARKALAWCAERMREEPPARFENLTKLFEKDKTIWERILRQEETKERLGEIVESLKMIKDLRGENRLFSLVLIGSLTTREYVPDLSDIDILLIAKNLKRGLKVEYYQAKGLEIEMNVVCRSPTFFERSLRKGTPVDLAAFKYGQVLYDSGYFAHLRKKPKASPTRYTQQFWLKIGLHHFTEAVDQYFSPACAHCFFKALYHAAKQLLGVILLREGKDVLEGWEFLEAIEIISPGLAPHYSKIRKARLNWENYGFPLFIRRRSLSGKLGALIKATEKIVLAALSTEGLKVPTLDRLLKEIKAKHEVKRISTVHYSLEKREVAIMFWDEKEKVRFAKFQLSCQTGTPAPQKTE